MWRNLERTMDDEVISFSTKQLVEKYFHEYSPTILDMLLEKIGGTFGLQVRDENDYWSPVIQLTLNHETGALYSKETTYQANESGFDLRICAIFKNDGHTTYRQIEDLSMVRADSAHGYDYHSVPIRSSGLVTFNIDSGVFTLEPDIEWIHKIVGGRMALSWLQIGLVFLILLCLYLSLFWFY